MTAYLARPELARHSSACYARRSVDSTASTLVSMHEDPLPESPRKRRPSLLRTTTGESRIDLFHGWRWRNQAVYIGVLLVVALFALGAWAGYRSSLTNVRTRTCGAPEPASSPRATKFTSRLTRSRLAARVR